MRTRTGCQACRDRHLKCVKQPNASKCDKCSENQRVCNQTNALLLFKPVKSVILKKTRNGQPARQSLTHDPSQVWVDVPSVNFAGQDSDTTVSDEITVPNTSLFHDDLALQQGSDSTLTALLHTNSSYPPLPSQGSYVPSTQPYHVTRPATSPASSRSFHQSPHSLQQTPRADPGQIMVSPAAYYSSPSHHSVRSEHRSAISLSSPSSSLSQSWPFTSSREAHLFYHYIKNIAPWIDVLDPHSYFGKEVPRRAAEHPIISTAIFALASRHLSILAGKEDHESPRYVHECLNMVINVLEDPLGHTDESLLAAVILLRSHEEFSDIDERCHLLGTSRILNSIASYAADGGFKESASWISLRQDIYISLTSQQPLGLQLSNYRHSSIFSDQSDEAWADRIVFTFATILNYVFEGQNAATPWSDLEAEVEAWKLTKPWYFNALWTKDSFGQTRSWPEMQVSYPAHAVGLQYYCLCKIVLAIYDPQLRKLGFASHRLRKTSEITVVDNLRMAVGLAVSNPDVTNAMFQGSHILSVCGSYLHDRRDQEAAVDFLVGMQNTMGWRTTQIIQDLREQWDA